MKIKSKHCLKVFQLDLEVHFVFSLTDHSANPVDVGGCFGENGRKGRSTAADRVTDHAAGEPSSVFRVDQRAAAVALARTEFRPR